MNNKQKLSFIINRKWAVLTAFFFCVLVHSIAYSQEMQVRIGVLALRGAEETVKRWTPTAEYLSTRISEYTFVIVPLDFEKIYEAVENGEVDFVLENSSIYVELEYLYGVDRIATLNDLWQEQAFNQFGGVIFTSKNRKDINNLDDLKNKSFMAVHETSFGGWRMAQREFKDYGIDPYRNFADMQFGDTHDKVVYAVQKGQVDAGTVRTGILEKMNKEGKINIKNFAILNQQHPDNFPLLLSTRLYPEWPFARVKHTSDQLSQQVSIALLSMPSDSEAARAAGIAGWTTPHHYQRVHDCLKELRVSPYEDLGKITLASLIQQYWYWILLGFISVIVLIAVVIYVIRLNRKLNISTIELKESQNRLEQKVEERTSELRQSNQQLIKENKDRRRAEKALQLEHDNFKNILGSMEDGVYIVNMEYEIQYINPVIKLEFGPANGHKCYEYLHRRIKVCPWCKISDVLLGKTVRWEWYSSKNQRTYDLIDTPFRNPDGSISKLEIFRDITERKQAEEELKKHREHLEELVKERTKELEAFSYSVSHDLRAPLRAIDGFTRILMDDYISQLDEEAKRLGMIIQSNSQKMGQLIDDLLTFSRMARTSMNFSEIDMKNMAKAIYYEATNAKLRKRITFTIADLSEVKGDTNMMRQVWMNFISNAIKFSANRDQAVISITCQEKENKLTYCIKDNGAGFNMKYKDKLFGVFQRLHSEKEFEGTGVGLALVQRIIHRHGGKVWAEGEVDKGAAFYFSLSKNGEI
ncbi:MAG: PhnD/SsuA/transferrin family substrate-binding protein [Calditrichia bacterium]|nr:PhnD/SsuA/transferrin family substrate-binding protein [Calditrichia bacterium]